MRILPAAFLVLNVLCPAQTPPPLAFDVASVKPQKWTGNGSVGVLVRGNTLDAEHADLNSLVEFAYDLKDFQLSGGPAWGIHGVLDSSELFQVLAKPASGQTPSVDEFRLMLQTLLADRFHLQVHHVNRQIPVYNLVVNKGGPKLKESAGGNTAINVRSAGPGGIHIDAINVTIPHALESQLGLYAGRPVFEKTGLTCYYDFTIEWTAIDTRTDLPSFPGLFRISSDSNWNRRPRHSTRS